jgi:hypothetical protein
MTTKKSTKRKLRQHFITRLQKLADHLEFGTLAHVKFNFGVFNDNYDASSNTVLRDGEAPLPGCGTAGCAIGECPAAFKGQWVFKKSESCVIDRPASYSPVLKSKKANQLAESIRSFFGLTNSEIDHLFIPGHQNSVYSATGTSYVSRSATKEEVAANIRSFLYKLKTNPWDAK